MIVRLTDLGDGSTSVRITLDNGRTLSISGDVPYEGYFEAEYDAEGNLVREDTVCE